MPLTFKKLKYSLVWKGNNILGGNILKFVRSTLGFMIAGMLVMTAFDAFAWQYGLAGGVFATFIVIGPMWFMNHYVGLIKNVDGHAFVDMTMGIGLTGIFRDTFIKGIPAFVDSIPTLALVVLGAVLAGFVAAAIETDMEKDAVGPADTEPGPGYDVDGGVNK